MIVTFLGASRIQTKKWFGSSIRSWSSALLRWVLCTTAFPKNIWSSQISVQSKWNLARPQMLGFSKLKQNRKLKRIRSSGTISETWASRHVLFGLAVTRYLLNAIFCPAKPSFGSAKPKSSPKFQLKAHVADARARAKRRGMRGATGWEMQKKRRKQKWYCAIFIIDCAVQVGKRTNGSTRPRKT